MRNYRKYKTNIQMEFYLTNVKNIKHRQAVTGLRLSSHKLEI